MNSHWEERYRKVGADAQLGGWTVHIWNFETRGGSPLTVGGSRVELGHCPGTSVLSAKWLGELEGQCAGNLAWVTHPLT